MRTPTTDRNLSGARCLVTGSDGFVGRHLLAPLLDAGAHVTAVTRNPSPGRADVRRMAVDLRDADATSNLVRVVQPTHVLHLAGTRGADARWEPLHDGNVVTTHRLLEALRVEGVDAWVLVAGSSAVYGTGGREPLTEDAPLRPVTLYGVAKAAQELMAVREVEAFGARVVRARLFNLVGPGQDSSMLVASVARQIALAEAGRRGPVDVGDLRSERDFVDVRDAVAALVLLASGTAASDAYNICSGVPTPVRECVDRLCGLARTPVELRVEDARVRGIDTPRQVGDFTRLRMAVNWQPEIPLKTTLRDALEDWRRRVADEPIA